jgi:hypothetical protein
VRTAIKIRLDFIQTSFAKIAITDQNATHWNEILMVCVWVETFLADSHEPQYRHFVISEPHGKHIWIFFAVSVVGRCSFLRHGVSP